jgi:cytochrome c oxidase cbb3-type subunit 3
VRAGTEGAANTSGCRRIAAVADGGNRSVAPNYRAQLPAHACAAYSEHARVTSWRQSGPADLQDINPMHAVRLLVVPLIALAPMLFAQAPQTPPVGHPAPETPPAQTPAPPAEGRGPGRGQGRGQGRGPGTFPAQQRALAEPAVIERGKALFAVTCSACHGADLRGGQLGGPNLLRSQVMLSDQHGELLLPIVRGARADKGMPPLPLPDDDVIAIAEYIHAVHAAAGRQGSPPPSDAPPPNIVVGDPASGQAYFAAKCSSCHSAAGDLQGIATKIPDPKALQNLWVSGGVVSGRGRGGAPGSARRPVTATVALPGGEMIQGRLVRIDHFIVTLMLEDGTFRTVRREGDRPKVQITDPTEAHRALLATYTEKDIHDVTAYLVTLK